jgi:hypothetical protein
MSLVLDSDRLSGKPSAAKHPTWWPDLAPFIGAFSFIGKERP